MTTQKGKSRKKISQGSLRSQLKNICILLEIQRRVSDPQESAAGVMYLSMRIHPRSCCVFAFWFKEGFGWRTVVTKLRLVSRLHGNTLSPDIYLRKPATRWVHLELCYRNPDILKKILNWIALSSATARKYTPMQDIKQPEHGRTSTTKDKK